MATQKVNISINDIDYKTKCNGKVCYVCGLPAQGYIAKYCNGKGDKKHEETCPLCKEDIPANVPVCNKKECISELTDTYTDPVDKTKLVTGLTKEIDDGIQ